MFTICPGCSRQFRVRAEQLAAASGKVMCGFCGEQFNALANISDAPIHTNKVPRTEQFEEQQQLNDEIAEPVESAQETIIDDADFSIPDVDDNKTVDDGVYVEQAHKVISELEDRLATFSAEPAEVEVEEEQVEPVATIAAKVDKPETRDNVHYEFPEELLAEPKTRRSRLSVYLWALGVIFLVLLLALQLLWFNRDQVLVRYPKLAPLMKQICEQLDCRLTRHMEDSAIELLNRDVRLHPNLEDSLLVNATMANRSQTMQPFPMIQLSLFDTDGKMVSYRRFSPAEYLDNSINQDQGMEPGKPVHFVLEIAGHITSAVSFEFDFL